MGVYLPARLPSTYQEVEYIQSSGTQYIDTGKTVSGDVKIDYTYMPKETVTSSTTGGLLVFIDNERRNNGFGSSNTYTYYGGKTSNNEGYTVGTLQQDVLCHDIVAKSGCSRTLNGTTVSYVPSSSYPSPTGTLKLFVSQRAGSITNYWKTRMYSFKRYDSGVLTQDLVPCYRKSDNVIGMYDLVNSQFYTNSGTGTFTKGADVTAVPLKNAYIGDVREPGVNTILYMPLKTDLLDYGPNNIAMTTSGNVSIDTYGAKFNGGGIAGDTEAIISGDFTFSIWFNATSAGTDCNLIIIGQGYPGKGYRYGANSSGKIGFTLTSVIDWNYGTAFSTLYGGWHNMVMTRAGTTNTLYVDGLSKGTYSGTSVPSSTHIGIGGTDRWAMNGFMNYAIIESVARSATEVSNYYNNIKGKYGL